MFFSGSGARSNVDWVNPLADLLALIPLAYILSAPYAAPWLATGGFLFEPDLTEPLFLMSYGLGWVALLVLGIFHRELGEVVGFVTRITLQLYWVLGLFAIIPGGFVLLLTILTSREGIHLEFAGGLMFATLPAIVSAALIPFVKDGGLHK